MGWVSRTPVVCALALACVSGAVSGARAQDDAIAQARALAAGGHRLEAIRLLREHLAAAPGDSDARVLLGLVLSWDGQYDGARAELRAVLEDSPGHGDALPALMNIEIWDGHPERADSLAGPLTTEDSRVNVPVFLGRARALAAMHRTAEARRLVQRALDARPSSEEARMLLAAYDAVLRRWEAQAGYAHDWFPGSDRKPWREAWVSLKHETPVGAVIGRASQAERFGREDRLLEVDLYPRLGRGSYAYVNVGFASDRRLYPDYRIGFDVSQGFGRGWEASAGIRRLGFSEPVTLYVTALSKYRGNWLFTGRTFVAPELAGPSLSLHGIARRYFAAGGGYVGVRYSHGRSKEELRSVEDLALLDTDTLAGELDVRLSGRVRATVHGGVSRRERAAGRSMRHSTLSAMLGWRF